jgi:hypothetical protein
MNWPDKSKGKGGKVFRSSALAVGPKGKSLLLLGVVIGRENELQI